MSNTLIYELKWISDPNCHLAEQRVVGVIEGEQKGGAMTASAEGPAQGGAAEPVCNRRLGRMANLARADLGKAPTLRLAAGLSGHEVEPAPSGKGRRRRSGRAAVALGRRPLVPWDCEPELTVVGGVDQVAVHEKLPGLTDGDGLALGRLERRGSHEKTL